MLQIAIIGAGNLGGRHLQGLAGLHHECEIHLVDPCRESLATARERWAELPANPRICGLRDHGDVSSLPKHLELVIVATTSDVRLAVIRKLIDRAEVRYLLLEKVLFPRLAEYEEASEILRRSNVRAWVNCARRLFDVYARAREEFRAGKLIHMDVAGGNWGLGCNGIHFLDMMAFMAGEIPGRFNTSGLSPGTIPAKRPGFVEFSGTIAAMTSGCTISLTAHGTSAARHLVTLRGENLSYVIDELAGRYWKLDGTGAWTAGVFQIPLQSQMTGKVANQILATGECGLPEYEESSQVHQPFLQALINHLDPGRMHDAAACLIT